MSAGYSTYVIEPNLGGLQWMQGKVPTPDGNIELRVSTTEIKVTGAAGTGTLRFKSRSKPETNAGTFVNKANNVYELKIERGKAYTIKYELN